MATASTYRPQRRQRRNRTDTAPPQARDPFLILAAGLGLLVSAYLAFADLTGSATACLPGADCDVVRASAYGAVAGLPVAAVGVVYFLAVLGAALLPDTQARAAWRRRLLPLLGGAGLGAAAIFLGVQGLVLYAWCPYCLVADAAAVVVGLRILWPRQSGMPAGSLTRASVGATMGIAVLLAGFAFNPTVATTSTTASTRGVGTSASTMSPDRLAALAEHLRESGAVFYGAYWCPHCQAQKQMFGTAATRLPYVECDPRGADAQPDRCQAADVHAYPTWVIGGQKIEGEIPPRDLARLSGFGG